MKSTMQLNMEHMKNGTANLETIVSDRLSLIEKYHNYNAIVSCNKEQVIQQARELDAAIRSNNHVGELCGSIITVKDNLDVKGLSSTAGMEKFKNNIAKEDCPTVARLRREGAIILGKTNMPAGAMDMQTFNNIYGRTSHPDFPEYTCGGSSGGGATAIKLGISDADIGNDFMGSIRVPSHFCGIYGMIGTQKVLPYEQLVGGNPYGSTMSNILRIGIQASSLQDLNTLFCILANKNMIFPSSDSKTNIHIAYSEHCGELPLAQNYSLIFQEFITKLSKTYPTSSIKETQVDFKKARDCFLKLLYGNMSTTLPSIVWIAMGPKMSNKLKDYLLQEEERERIINQLDLLYQDYDILLTPVTASSAFPHILPKKMRGGQAIYDDMIIDGNKVPYSVANMGYTTPFSLSSSPVIVIPIGKTKEGLPLGIQVIGNRFHDLDLIKIASILEETLGQKLIMETDLL